MNGHGNIYLLPLFLISILAFLVPILTSWFSSKTKIPIPVVVGEIICGIIIGKYGLGIINTTDTIPWLSFLYLFGFTYLMFLSGLEVDISGLVKTEKFNKKLNKKFWESPSLVFLGVNYFILTLLLSFWVSIFLFTKGYISNIVMMTLILSTTSVSIVVPVLKEKFLAKTELGQTILISALVADFLTMTLITIFVALSAKDPSTFNLLFMILLLALIVLVYKMHVSKTFDWVIQKLLLIKPFFTKLAHATAQIKVRGAIALMVIFIAASQAMGFEVILGAFLAGILTTLILGEEKTDELEMKLDAIGYGFFIPIFFISVGINLDLKIFFESESGWILLGFLVLSAFIIKILPAIIFKLKFPMKDVLSAGVLLSARLSLVIAASTIGLKEGFITEEINAVIVMVAVISCILSPVLFNKILQKPNEEIIESTEDIRGV
jgi:Kef-type K+ transport system membrane component KefB